MKLWCLLDAGLIKQNGQWGREVRDAALAAGHDATLFTMAGNQLGSWADVESHLNVRGPAYLFMRIAQYPPQLDTDRALAHRLIERGDLISIQDRLQIDLYENKIEQTRAFASFMPQTWIAEDIESAYRLCDAIDFPVVSKASVGSSSVNIRLLATRDEGLQEVERIFTGSGVRIVGGPSRKTLQRGYILWQEFIPHEVTWRVTIVGTRYSVYKRFCYPDRPMAAPASVVPTEPVTCCSPEVESLLAFSRGFFESVATKWCAIDVLQQGAEWKLLETAIGWGRCHRRHEFPFLDTLYSLGTQAELLIAEIERGVFDEPRRVQSAHHDSGAHAGAGCD